MKLLGIQTPAKQTEFESFLDQVSEKLASAICKKMQGFAELGEVYSSNSLKILNPRIWGYKGTIYKLRVDCGKESARVLFAKNEENDLVLLHGFLKRTRKTPRKDAMIAMQNLERLRQKIALAPLPIEQYTQL
ncbi:type II toxin-antitoxin system RelE/ParE family toxin [Desulfobulbus rhabdoformis]|uniref:type II toxin-antitoxin system RelE/ParE family toxin n=1 Tax=Desulfobulbus rhabdoformis TaxID=34032 RepID=UPI00308419CC